MLNVFLGFTAGVCSGSVCVFVYLFFKNRFLLNAKKNAAAWLEEAKQEAYLRKREILDRAKDEARNKRHELELESRKKLMEYQKLEHGLKKKLDAAEDMEFTLSKKTKELDDKYSELENRALRMRSKEERVENSLQTLVEQLEKISHMSRVEAKEMLVGTLRDEVELENSQRIAKSIENANLTAKDKAVDILCSTMQRYVADQVSSCSSASVVLPNEDLKGRIIGKEGRNIKSLEMATGMEFVIGDSDIITISGFNPVRREIAKNTLDALLKDGRINPTRIEEVAEKCEAEIKENIEEIGRRTVLEMNFSGIDKRIITLLGQLHFRTSYTQNVLEHSRETASFARMIAEELKLDGAIAARCGLLHDIGKAVSHEIDGPHALVGADIAKKHGESEIVVNAIAAHHEDIAPSSIYAVIVMIADTISASRVGARKETLSTYVKRLEQLEEIANAFDGVKRAYALQAGREVRIIVDESRMDDTQSMMLARSIATRVEQEMNFPGQIKVNVIREKRSIEYAK